VTKKRPTKKRPTKKRPTKKLPTKKLPSKKRPTARRPSEADVVRDIAAAYKFIDQQNRDLRSRRPQVRLRAQRTKADLDRLDREIAQALTRKPR